MPFYSMKNTETDEIFTIELKMAEREIYLNENPHIKQILTSFPGIVDSVRIGVRKSDENFKDVLRNAKKNFRHSTIEV